MSLRTAIERANSLFPGTPAPDGENDPRWEAIMAVGDYIESNPEEVWQFVTRWGAHEQEDLRSAIGCCLLEHLLEYHFDLIFPRVEELARKDKLFADTFCYCSKFGESKIPANSRRMDRLRRLCGRTVNW